jgi:hypothetical protein
MSFTGIYGIMKAIQIIAKYGVEKYKPWFEQHILGAVGDAGGGGEAAGEGEEDVEGDEAAEEETGAGGEEGVDDD